MEQRIKDYVDYHFRIDHRDDIEDIKQEMWNNLIDRYHDYVSEGKDPEEAYIETIKYLGEVSDLKDDDIDGNFNWARIAMVTVTALSYSAVVLSIFSSLIGLIVTLTSIVLFSTAGYYLYVNSQFVKKEKFDLELQRVNMRIIMKYFRQNYLPWNISFSISFTGIIMGVILLLVAEDIPSLILSDGIFPVIMSYLFLGVVVFILLFFLLKAVENRLYKHYTVITGEDVPNFKVNGVFKGLLSGLNGYVVFLILSTIFVNLVYATVEISLDWRVSAPYFILTSELPILIIPIFISVANIIFLILNAKMVKQPLSKAIHFVLNLMNLLGYLLVSGYLEFYTRHQFVSVFGITVYLTIGLLIVFLVPRLTSLFRDRKQT